METFSAGEFLQGFLDEAGEHLARINQNLLRLEQGDALERPELLNELFRSFHTIKGLCGMVNLTPGAELSHAMENLLRALQEDQLSPNQAVIDRLLQGTRVLTEVVDSVRGPGNPAPDVAPEIQAFDALLHPSIAAPAPLMPAAEKGSLPAPLTPPPAGTVAAPETAHNEVSVLTFLPELAGYPDLLRNLTAVDQRKILAAAQARQSLMVVRFTPSQARAERGENVDQVREQLHQQGTLIKAIPTVLEGKVTFLFLVAAARPLESGSAIADEIIPLYIRPVEPPTPTATHTAAPVVPARTTVRVDLERLDDLIRYTGDLILLRGRLGENLARLDGAPPAIRRELAQVNQQMGRVLRDLRRAILHARMVPLAETFNHMPLVVRDLARTSQKEVRLVIHGENTEVDKALVERLLDPLIHLIRNAIIHGIESPEERVRLGKPPAGTLTLQGFPEGDLICIEVADDGRGVNLEQVAQKAASLGWREPGAPLDAIEALNIITRPGFSTQGEATLAAGRGVGLDVVQRVVRSFGGQMEMETRLGQGVTFRLRLPLTLVVMDALFVRAGRQQYAVPRDAVERIIEINPREIIRAESGELLPAQDSYFVVHRLEAFGNKKADIQGNSTEAQPRVYGLVGLEYTRPEGSNNAPSETTRLEARQLLLVDAVQDLREVVVQTLADPLIARPGIGGATETGDGRVVLILDLPTLFQTLQKGPSIPERSEGR